MCVWWRMPECVMLLVSHAETLVFVLSVSERIGSMLAMATAVPDTAIAAMFPLL